MAWILDGTTIIPYGMDCTHGPNKSTLSSKALLNGGHRVGITTQRKRWRFRLQWISTTDAATIKTSLLKQSFTLHDEYENFDYTVHCTYLNDFNYYDVTKIRTGAEIELEVI